MSYIGANKIGGMHLGSTTIAKAYLGSDLVYQTSGVTPSLPYDAEVEYLECNGYQTYIDTGITPNQDTKIETKLYTDKTGALGTNFWYGARESATATNSVRAIYYLRVNGNGERFAYGTQALYITGNISKPLTRIIVHDKNNLYVDGTLVNTYTYSTWQAPCTMAIGNIFSTSNKTVFSYSDGTTSICRIYYFKIYDDDTLVRDYIPVRVGTTGYLYDKVSGQLFGNSGTGNFTFGNDIT